MFAVYIINSSYGAITPACAMIDGHAKGFAISI